MKKKFHWKIIIPTMVVVAIGSIVMLKTKYQEVETRDAIIIGIVATLLSGMIAHHLFPKDEAGKIDPKPAETKKVGKK